ncbi:co(2)-response secreted protease [Phtheirospermum japonicum]|uniref:Co(2)-response secreted protease n=1 Tax=Phtheirospermum japonicum TaxID=374723 RepID=A0A830CAJ0_9LAMI|nr:co(2)-response secreted protease [Phtheirospermum japonicum]
MSACSLSDMASSNICRGRRRLLVGGVLTNGLPYIVYLGSSSDTGGVVDNLSHLQLFEETERKVLLNSYDHAFKGFSAMLTENEASALSGYDEVVSVFPDPILNLHTTRSWDFLEAADSEFQSRYPYVQNSADVIIGIIDTGIWPESPSFDDRHIGKIPSKWKGVCMAGSDFKKSNCNRYSNFRNTSCTVINLYSWLKLARWLVRAHRANGNQSGPGFLGTAFHGPEHGKKLIGARFYSNQPAKSNGTSPVQTEGSPRDQVGHGTHTASISGGVTVGNASYYGLARGTARGGSPSARIASYKACVEGGCAGSTILKAIDDAVKDGVDIISISIGTSSLFQSEFLSDPIAIGAFHAEQKGVMVVCSAGNDGPGPYTVVNTAPWVFTVAASTIDRNFQSSVLLGNNKSYEGSAINFSPLGPGQRYPLAFAENIALSFTPAADARNCAPGSLDAKKVAGKIIVCMNDEPNVSRRIKSLVVEDAKGKGVIIIDGQGDIITPYDAGTYPFAQVGQNVGSQILRYIDSTKNPTATILGTTEIKPFKPAPIVASFSSRGPGGLTENILKPDITAPGVAILAAIVPRVRSDYSAPGNKPSSFGLRSGTSMACPHVTGAMAFIKSVRPRWSFSVIKSALMTTASTSNNMGKTITNGSRSYANPHEVGAGEIRPIRALDPGLAFETSIDDYLYFLCYYGYKQRDIRSISNTKFICPKRPAEELISSINYPSISIGRLSRREGPRKVKRVVTNVGSSPNVTYVVTSVNGPAGLVVKVVPSKIVFTEGLRTASFKVYFDGKQASKGYNYGDIRLFDGSHLVRVVFAVNVE